MLKYIVTGACYRGHTIMMAPRPNMPPVPQVINQRLDAGWEKGPDGKDTAIPIMYVQCGRPDCQCAVPQVSQVLVPADEETRIATDKHRVHLDRERLERTKVHALTRLNDPDALRAQLASSMDAQHRMEENEKLRQQLADLQAQVAELRKPAAPAAPNAPKR